MILMCRAEEELAVATSSTTPQKEETAGRIEFLHPLILVIGDVQFSARAQGKVARMEEAMLGLPDELDRSGRRGRRLGGWRTGGERRRDDDDARRRCSR